MRYLIVSDSHGIHDYLDEVMYSVGHIDGMFHLGDVENRETDIEAQIDCPLEIVCGNNDSDYFLPQERIVFVGEHKIFMAHGHQYRIHQGTEMIKRAAKEKGCDIVLFGHTHRPYLEKEEDMVIANPGSITYPRQEDRQPTYMILETDGKNRVDFKIYRWEE